MKISLIANSGIQLFTFPLEISKNEAFSMLFRESFDGDSGLYKLDLIHEVSDYGEAHYFMKKDLYKYGYLASHVGELEYGSILADGSIQEIPEGSGNVFPMRFSSNDNKFSCLQNVWLPLPYMNVRTGGKKKKFDFSPLNWARIKLIHVCDPDESRSLFNVILAFDTRITTQDINFSECPVFASFSTEQNYELCSDEFMLMDYCACNSPHTGEFVDKYIMSLVYPDAKSIGMIRNEKHRLAYLATYMHLINFLAQKGLCPGITLFRSDNVQNKGVDMFIDIGNSKTTVILVEDHQNFNQVRQLSLQDYTTLIEPGEKPVLKRYTGPFDMRLVFRRVDFGSISADLNSRQFVFPSLVRLGEEANYLIHKTSSSSLGDAQLSTYSSPKRYLWDNKAAEKEWEFLVLEGEKDNHILQVPGITNQLNDDGSLDRRGIGGIMHNYSRSSLMTFAFLEMIAQADVQVNSLDYREFRGNARMPRLIRKIVATCPTTMSRMERTAMMNSLRDAVELYRNFYKNSQDSATSKPIVNTRIDIWPKLSKPGDETKEWYYDEATCAQLVYMFSEVAHKYKGNCDEFFNLYGKPGLATPQLVVGSLDIGAGTSDLMISNYTFSIDNGSTVIRPEPVFYDSFYRAGDDILHDLIRFVMFDGNETPIHKKLMEMGIGSPRQRIKDFFGHDFNEESMKARKLRCDFNIQVSVPLMNFFLQQLSDETPKCTFTFSQVFGDNPPGALVLDHFKDHFGFDFSDLVWEFDPKRFNRIISGAIEPLLKQISAIMYAYACDIIVLSGRPSSLPVITEIFRSSFAVSPNRLICLNKFDVGDWYPFSANSEYIQNPKTVVAVGSMIAHLSSVLGMYSNFRLDTSGLAGKIRPTINFVRQQGAADFCLTDVSHTGSITVTSLPTYLCVRQKEYPSYPERTLFKIDYNYFNLFNAISRKTLDDGSLIPESAVPQKVAEEVERIRTTCLPLRLDIRRSPEDIEDIVIEAAYSRDKEEVDVKNFNIYIESLGSKDSYWLDTGAFEF